MPLYYLHIYNDEVTEDEEGTELVDDQAALARATAEARNLASESVKMHGHLILSHRLDVVDGDGRLVGSVSFGDVVDVLP